MISEEQNMISEEQNTISEDGIKLRLNWAFVAEKCSPIPIRGPIFARWCSNKIAKLMLQYER